MFKQEYILKIVTPPMITFSINMAAYVYQMVAKKQMFWFK